jgi:hypothetical protein
MFDRPTMTDDECSPWPPALEFTPEVRSGILSAADLAFGPGWVIDPKMGDLDRIAHQIASAPPDALS